MNNVIHNGTEHELFYMGENEALTFYTSTQAKPWRHRLDFSGPQPSQYSIDSFL